MKKILFIAFLSICQFAFAQSRGTIKGLLTDKEMGGEPLPFANVSIKGTTIGVATDMDGNYTLQAPVGSQTIVFSFVGYQTVEKVVDVKAGKTITLNQELGASEGVSLEEVEVKATVSKEKETALLSEQKKAVIIQTKIGAQELSRKGVSDAEGAVAKVSGVSKQEGIKNVFVRGLGDRYNSTSLNGFPIPSEDPEYKNISLDFFGTDIIKNVGISKVFSSSIPGDVGGANIDIASKELSKNSELKVDVSGGVNTQVLKNDFYQQDGVNYFGFSNSKDPGANVNQFNFQNSLDPTKQNSPFDHGFGISAGKRFNFENEDRLSLLFVASHSTDYSYVNQTIRKTTTTGQKDAEYSGKKSSRNISQIGLVNALYRLKQHRIGYNFMLIHNNNQYVGDYLGYDSGKYEDAYDNKTGFLRRQQNNDNMLMVNQITSNWKLTESIGLDAGFSYNNVRGLEPDRRINTLSKKSATEDKYELIAGTATQVRYFTTLKKHDYNAKLSLFRKLNTSDDEDNVSKISFGYSGRFVTDDFISIEYDFKAPSDVVSLSTLSLDNLYNQENLTKGEFAIQRNFSIYDVKKNINSGFIDFTYKVLPDFVASVGARVDDVDLTIGYNVNRGKFEGSSNIDKTYILPSANLKYSISEKSSIRLGSSKTYTLPQSKEISPYLYIGMDFDSQGNMNLKPSENYNLDLKWEHFMTSSELLSLTGFYKYIEKPIARVEEGGSGGYLTYKNIAKDAKVLGVELEFRKHLLNSDLDEDYEGDNRYKLTAGLNMSYIYSELEVDVLNTPVTKSELEGSAPFLLNTDITYSFTKNEKNFTNSLVLNYFSDRIFTIGTLSYEDIIEKGVVSLDFVSSSQLTKNLSVKVRAKNLTNPTYVFSRDSDKGSVVLNSYKKGINLSLGLSYQF